MMLGAFMCLYGLLVHLKAVTKPEVPDQYFPIFFLLNICSIFCGCIGFGAPNAPVYVTSVGVIVILMSIIFKYDYMIPWLEKFFIILSIFGVTVEYFYRGVQYHKKSNNRSEIKYMICVLATIFSIFLCLLYLV